jgi:PIN domain nuclease of toxin-antitoxin system
MNLLLDTHVFLWFIDGDKRLKRAWVERIRDPDNTVFLSVVSLWETIVKYDLGKLSLPARPEAYIPEQRNLHRISSLLLDESSVKRLANLPLLHRDPFDRMLVCQALAHDLTLVTVDPAVRAYPVDCL